MKNKSTPWIRSVDYLEVLHESEISKNEDYKEEAPRKPAADSTYKCWPQDISGG